MPKKKSREQLRLEEEAPGPVPKWQKWGPFVAERAWGTVREDYSANGDPWNYFPHDLAFSKTYRWGEDGIAGWCDRYQVLVFAPVFWNGADPVLKERFFGLSSYEGNHGEDVKECYFYLDGTPTHSYMKFLYKYPQAEFPYQALVEENRKRSTADPEFELVDTGIFAGNRYFDIFVEYAKASPEDLCIRIEAFNRNTEAATLHVLPHLWFRNQWSWSDLRQPEPKIEKGKGDGLCLIADDAAMNSPLNLAFDYHLGKRYLYGPKGGKALFTNNETDFKQGFHLAVVNGENDLISEEAGTKSCIHYIFENIPPGKSVVLHLRLSDKPMHEPLKDIEEIIAERKREADEFYEEIQPEKATAEEKMIQRQALAGVLWSKQVYLYDVNLWLRGDNTFFPPPESRNHIRNFHWRHLNSMRVLAMPDKWEYPWFAAWDQSFHSLALGLVDIEFAKEQLWLLLFDQFQHPNGQIPAYEWEFSEMNPPVQAWAALRLYRMEKERFGRQDLMFLEKCFLKLLINFAWWVNKVDSSGNNVFEGGFLGLDNITVLDRSQKLPGGGKLQQSDGTGWMAMFCLDLMSIALELSNQNVAYEGLATKFFEHYVYIAHAMKKHGNTDYEMWSDKDGFFYDALTYPDGKFAKFRVRSLVGLIPLYAALEFDEEYLKKFPEFYKNFNWFLSNRQPLVHNCITILERKGKKTFIFTVMNQAQLKSVLSYVWNPDEFRAPFGLRSLSKYHLDHPFVFEDKKISYETGDSLYKVKGGNSNWRGPIWMPTAFLLIDSLKKLAAGFKHEIKIEAGQETPVDLDQMARSFADRLISLFAKGKDGSRPFFGPEFPFREDPYWRDHLLFYEFFNPETGKGHGASHQTGWTALVANLIDEFRR